MTGRIEVDLAGILERTAGLERAAVRNTDCAGAGAGAGCAVRDGEPVTAGDRKRRCADRRQRSDDFIGAHRDGVGAASIDRDVVIRRRHRIAAPILRVAELPNDASLPTNIRHDVAPVRYKKTFLSDRDGSLLCKV